MKKFLLHHVPLLLFSAVLFNGCGKSNDMSPTPAGNTKKGVLLATNPTFGAILTDSAGRSLYVFAPDVKGGSACTGNCEVVWPPYYTQAKIETSGLDPADFATIARADGRKQTTYKGWPLYYYKDDAAAGDVKGDKVGGIWFVSKPDYAVMIGRTQLVGNDGKNYSQQLTEGTGAFTFFTDAYGRTLYAFSPDHKNQNRFTKSDFSNNAFWPVYEMSPQKFPSILSAADFSTTAVFGRTQLSFKGWPMYYFGPDAMKQGVTKGVSIPNWQICYNTLPEAPL